MNRKRPYRKVVYRKKIMILLVQIVNRNLGDTVIADNAEYLVQQALPRIGGRHYVLQYYDIQSEDYELVRAADLIIFGGGGLIKYKQEKFHEYVPALLACAEECGIPVYFNSVGVEGYDEEDERCLQLARALNYNCVKAVTVRDDLETLRKDYLKNDQIITSAAVDTAIFTPYVYDIRKNEQSHTIGLGIVRHRIFEDYGIPEITREFQLDMWKGIIQQLETNGLQWKMFVNGLRSDYDFALEILEYMGRSSQAEYLLVPRPIESRELVAAIASFEGIIACRMHANIIAYALGIPSIGLVWNEKMVYWGERIGYPERFLNSTQFEPIRIVQSLMDSMSKGVRPCSGAMKNSLLKPLKKFIRTYGAPAWKKKSTEYVPRPRDWSDVLAASALGGIHMRYTNMNTKKGLELALEHGFRILEADIRLTKDGRLVCVNGWSKGSYEKLGADPKDYEDSCMDYRTFMDCRMYGNYETMDAVQLFNRMQQEESSWKLILDIGRPNKETLADMIQKLKLLCCGESDGDAEDYSRDDIADGSLGGAGGNEAEAGSGFAEAGSDASKPGSSLAEADGNESNSGSMLSQGGSCMEAGSMPDENPEQDAGAAYWQERLYIRVQSKYDVEAIQAAGLPIQIMYYIPPKQRREEKKISLQSIGKYCKKRSIEWVSMPKEALDEEVMDYLKKEQLRSCVFSYNSYSDVQSALELGADWIATSYLSPQQLADWYERKYTIVIR